MFKNNRLSWVCCWPWTHQVRHSVGGGLNAIGVGRIWDTLALALSVACWGHGTLNTEIIVPLCLHFSVLCTTAVVLIDAVVQSDTLNASLRRQRCLYIYRLIFCDASHALHVRQHIAYRENRSSFSYCKITENSKFTQNYGTHIVFIARQHTELCWARFRNRLRLSVCWSVRTISVSRLTWGLFLKRKASERSHINSC